MFYGDLLRELCNAVTNAPFGTKKYRIVAPEACITAVITLRKVRVERPIVQRDVRRARNTCRIAIASPRDFVTTASAAGDVGITLPYCLDFLRRRALYVGGVDIAAAQAAPFYYLYLRQTAQRLVSVPFEHLPTSPSVDPVFLFSPGRVGSTLISRVLAEAGVASVSEPDFYTQLATPFWQSPLNPLRSAVRSAMWQMSDDLCAALGARPVVKLRAECARYPELFLHQPKNRTIVLFRDFETWSRSTAQVFGAGPRKAVGKYLAALRCYQVLRRRGHCHLMRYEDWMAAPDVAAKALGDFLGVPIAEEAVRRAFANHSQNGTPLIRREKPGWRAKWQGALALWETPRIRRIRAQLGDASIGA